LDLRRWPSIRPRAVLGLGQCADDRFTGQTIRPQVLKHRSDAGEKLNPEAVVRGLLSGQFDGRLPSAIRPIPTHGLGNPEERRHCPPFFRSDHVFLTYASVSSSLPNVAHWKAIRRSATHSLSQASVCGQGFGGVGRLNVFEGRLTLVDQQYQRGICLQQKRP